jgi:hypothetical protein
MTAMDVTIHASFLPHDDPPAAGQAHSNTSFIARGWSSNGRWEHQASAREDANAQEEADAEQMTTTRTPPPKSTQRGQMI